MQLNVVSHTTNNDLSNKTYFCAGFLKESCMEPNLKNILIVFTGGTFSMQIDKATGGAIPRFSGEELIGMIPEAKTGLKKMYLMVL
jgi:L-asparaginase/Glu-tRNA(Gln) amidotransferase subunit D